MKLYYARNVGKTVSAFAMALLLVGCCNTPVKPEMQVVNRVEYVIKTPSADLMQLPAKVTPLNVDDPSLKQSDVARWLTKLQDRQDQLENQLIGIAKFFQTEQGKLNDQSKKENAK